MSTVTKRKLEWLSNIRQNNLEDKIVTRDKEGHTVLMKGSVYLGDITIINIYLPEDRAPKYTKLN